MEELKKVSSMVKSESKKIPISQLNNILGPKKSLYDKLIIRGDYLPDIKSRCINNVYLYKVLNKKVFHLPRKGLENGYIFKNISIAKLIQILETLAKLDLGFDEFNPPNRDWLINYIKILYNVYEIF